jgi:integrase
MEGLTPASPDSPPPLRELIADEPFWRYPAGASGEGAALPVIKFHAARHTAATLALEAGVDIKIVSEQLGHSTTRITQDLCQHVRHQVRMDSAEKVVDLLPGRKGTHEAGS